MLGKELRWLAEVADLARLDFEAASLALVAQDHTIVSHYEGTYCGGQRWLMTDKPLDIKAEVQGKQFKDLAALFDENVQIALKQVDTGVQIEQRSPPARVTLRSRGVVEGIDAFGEIDGAVCEVEQDKLLAEVELAAEFVAKVMTKPILTGVRLAVTSKRIGVQSYDGYSSLFQSEVPCESDKSFEVVVPAFDLILGLRLMSGGKIKLNKPLRGERLFVFGSNASFRTSLLAGEWPDTKKIREARERVELQIPAATIRSVTSAARALGAGNDVTLRGTDGGAILLETLEAESGRFVTRSDGQIVGTHRFDIANFALAARLGDPVHLALGDKQTPALVTSGTRSYWIAQKI